VTVGAAAFAKGTEFEKTKLKMTVLITLRKKRFILSPMLFMTKLSELGVLFLTPSTLSVPHVQAYNGKSPGGDNPPRAFALSKAQANYAFTFFAILATVLAKVVI
jgi:hypothetical protein